MDTTFEKPIPQLTSGLIPLGILNLDNNKEFTHVLKKSDIIRLAPTSGSNAYMNSNGTLVYQLSQTTDPIDICNAKLVYEIEIENSDCVLETNSFPKLFSCMSLKLGNYVVESINNPGVVSDMLLCFKRS